MSALSRLLQPSLQSDRFWLGGVMLGLAALFLSLGWKRSGDVDSLAVDLLFYAGIFWLLWRKRNRLSLEAGLGSTLAGLLLVAWLLFKSLRLFCFESLFLKLAPPAALVAVALLASGFRGLGQYRWEALLLCLMVFPLTKLWPPIQRMFNLEVLTAAFAGFLLHYSGFESAQRGAEVILPTGSVEVSTVCSSVPMMLLLLKLALLGIIVLPMSGWRRVCVPAAALAVGFVLGGVRVAVMAAVAADPARFDYWHGEPGAQIFSALAVLLFASLCYAVARRKDRRITADE